MNYKNLYALSLLVGIGAAFTSSGFTATPAAAADTLDTKALEAQLKALQQKVEGLEKTQKAHKHHAKKKEQHCHDAPKAESAVEKKEMAAFPKGYIAIPQTQSAIKISGRVKVDASFNEGPTTLIQGGSLNPTNIPLDLANTNNNTRKDHFGATVQGSRLNLETITNTSHGEIKSFVNFDFLGNHVNGGNATDYGIRLRQAYVEFMNIRVGQDKSNFVNPEFDVYALENFGVAVPPRRTMIRYSHSFGGKSALLVALEKPNTDYVNRDASVKGNETYGKASFPDVTARLRFENDLGFIALGAIWRRLSVEGYDSSGLTDTDKVIGANENGFGGSLGIRVNIPGSKSHFFGQFIAGRGLGMMTPDSGPAAYLKYNLAANTTTSTAADTGESLERYKKDFSLTSSFSGVIGYQHAWSECLKTTLGYIHTYIRYPKNIIVLNGETQLNKRVQRVMANVVYSVNSSIDVGFEVMHGKRETINGYVVKQGKSGTLGDTNLPYHPGSQAKATLFTATIMYKF